MRATAADVERVEERQGERRRLAGAGRRLADEIVSGDEVRDRLALDRRRLLVAELGQRVEQLGSQAEVGEAVVSGVVGLHPALLYQLATPAAPARAAA